MNFCPTALGFFAIKDGFVVWPSRNPNKSLISLVSNGSPLSKNILVLLAGCGAKDGAEIQEAVLTLLAIKKEGCDYTCASLNKNTRVCIACDITLATEYIKTKTGEELVVLTKDLFTAAGYTYGPLLGLFSFGIFTKYMVKDKYVWIVALVSVSFVLFLAKTPAESLGGYAVGYELLPLNGLLTFIGLWLIRDKGKETKIAS